MAKKHKSQAFQVVGIVFVIILAVVTVLNASKLQEFVSPANPESKPAASRRMPQTTQKYTDKLTVAKGDKLEDTGDVDIVVRNKQAEVELEEGGMETGALTFTETLEGEYLARMKAVRPKVSDKNSGLTGMVFTTSDGDGVLARQLRNGKHYVVFYTDGPDGESNRVEKAIGANPVILRLMRVADEVVAQYRYGGDVRGLSTGPKNVFDKGIDGSEIGGTTELGRSPEGGSDEDDDKNDKKAKWETLAALGASDVDLDGTGSVYFFANNNAAGYPAMTGIFDTIVVEW